MGCKNEKTENSGEAVIDKEVENETLLDSLIESLSGVEYYFVKHREIFNDKEDLHNRLLSLLEYKNDSNYNKLKHNHNRQIRIRTLNSKNGYLVAEWAESINYFTYWNLTDGSGNKLLAVVSRGCGPVCDDTIWFYRIIKYNSENAGYRFEKVKTNDIIKNFDKLPEILIGHEIDDYYPISYNLPQKGKNILMCNPDDINLNPEDDNSLESKGNCIELIWNGDQGTFTPGEQVKK